MFLQAIGLLVTLYSIYKIIFFVWFMIRCYVLPSFGFVVNLKKYGEWAVVTGATDGIGRGYAEELAKKGLKIVLISRNPDKLQTVAKHISESYGVETKTIVFDFAAQLDYTVIKEELTDLNIGVLINNVGMGGVCMEFFDRIDIQNITDVTHCNIFGELNLTHIVLPGMIERKRGIVVHMASVMGFLPSGMCNVYPATKAFIVSWSKALQKECEVIKDLHHQLITPGIVSTNLVPVPVTPCLFPNALTFAKSAVNTIGLTEHALGYWGHEFHGLLLLSLPYNLMERCLFGFGFQQIRLCKRFVLEKKD